MKNIAKFAVGVGVASVAMLSTTLPAQAVVGGDWSVRSTSKTCSTAWDHIDQNGNPYGTTKLVCPGGSTGTSVDWDMATWPNGYCLHWKSSGSTTIHSSCANPGKQKFTDAFSGQIWTVAR